jgi:multidrug resistance efflux pump
MSTAFSRTMHSLQADRFRGRGLLLAVSFFLMGAWLSWGLFTRLTLYEISSRARVEVDSAATPLQAPIAGRVVVSQLSMGREVAAGDVLVEIESQGEQLDLDRSRTRLQALQQEYQSVQAQLRAENEARLAEQRAWRARVQEAGSAVREAEVPARFAAEEAERLKRMRAEGLIAERDYLKAQAEATRTRATADTSRLSVQRFEEEQLTRDRERAVRLRQLETESMRLSGEQQELRRAMQRTDYEVQRRIIRAPMAGRIGEATVLRAGSYVEEGAALGSIVPRSGLAVVAYFPPASALGRIRRGQTARLRLEAYPWAQYGTVPAVVTEVANEVRDGQVRVQFAMQEEAAPRIPLEHGMPGAIEVEIERISPAELALRTAGRWMATPVGRPES